MARKGQPSQPPHANLTTEQMRKGIARLKSRIAELKAVDVEAIREDSNPDLSALEDKVNATVTDILGGGTFEHLQFGYVRLDESPLIMGRSNPLYEVRRGYADGIARTIAKLEATVALFEEKIGGSAEDPVGRARRAFGDLDLHPEVARAVTQLFEDGHYANAVEDACKVLDLLVKMRSGRQDLSGTDLMLAVFSPKKPVLRFNDLQTDTDKSEQQGLMFLFAGAMLALRNPRAHHLIQDSPERALEYIAFLSLLAKTLDRARK